LRFLLGLGSGMQKYCTYLPSFDLDAIGNLCTLTVDRSQYLHEKEMKFQPQRKIILH
jgi:hypothetical protein